MGPGHIGGMLGGCFLVLPLNEDCFKKVIRLIKMVSVLAGLYLPWLLKVSLYLVAYRSIDLAYLSYEGRCCRLHTG